MFELSNEGREFVKSELKRYETKQSAIIPCLFRAQKENGGWISEEVIDHLSKVMEIPSAQIQEVFQFYTMFNKKPVGRFHVQVCTNVSCAILGGRELLNHLCKTFDVPVETRTADGLYTFSPVECLGSCGTAPMMQVNDRYYENLTPESAVEILKGMAKT